MTNLYLDLLREEFRMNGHDDPWGTAMEFGFMLCDTMTLYGAPVPASLGYSPAMGGPYESEIQDSFVGREILDAFNAQLQQHGPEETENSLTHAAKVLSRYLDLCKLAGLDY